jgi:hypothetical protein
LHKFLPILQKHPIFVCHIPISIINPKPVSMDKKELTPADRDGLPPFVNTWSQLYAILIVTLVALISVFYLFMIHFQ